MVCCVVACQNGRNGLMGIELAVVLKELKYMLAGKMILQ